MDKNGYNESILNTENGTCYLCGSKTDTARHEIYGASNRSISKKSGFWIDVCPMCHQHARYSIHGNPGEGFDRTLKEECQALYERTHTRREFIKLIGKSYL